MNFRKRKRREPRLIIVSLIDVVLQLVIFLLLTTTFEGREVALGVDLPAAETAAPAARTGLTVDIGPQGDMSVDGNPMDSAALGRLFQAESEAEDLGVVTIRADRLTRHGDVVKIVDLARKSRLDRLNIAVAALVGGSNAGNK